MKKYAGKDASEAFRQLHRHSPKARRLMSTMCVGALEDGSEGYRIFEHNNQILGLALSGQIFFVLGPYLGLAFTMGHDRGLGGYVSRDLPAWGSAALIAVVLAVLQGGGITVLLLLTGMRRPQVHLRQHILGVSMLLHGVALLVARRWAFRVDEASFALHPSPFEVAGVLGLFLMQIEEGLSSGRARPGTPSLGAGAVLLLLGTVVSSWVLRTDAASSGTPILWLQEAFPAGALLAVSTAGILQAIDDTRGQDFMIADVLCGLQLSAIYGVLLGGAGIYAGMPSPGFGGWFDTGTLGRQLVTSFYGLGCIAFFAQAATMVAFGMLNFGYVTAPSFARRTLAFACFVAGCGLSPLEWRWLAVFGVLLYGGRLGARNRAMLSKGVENKKRYVLGAQALWDQMRVTIATFIFKLIAPQWCRFCSWVVPEGMRYYAYPFPIFNLGEGVDMGVAAHFSPWSEDDHSRAAAVVAGDVPAAGPSEPSSSSSSSSSSSPPPPAFFVCNVGHVDNHHPAGLSDLQRTMNATRDIWKEFRGEKGLVANIVCLFPTISGTRNSKELNLSAWVSEQAAGEWYVRSKGHKRIMKNHSSGGLRTFGNMLASLKPKGKIRLQERCTNCARVVESDTLGEKAPERCPVCNGRTFGYPIF